MIHNMIIERSANSKLLVTTREMVTDATGEQTPQALVYSFDTMQEVYSLACQSFGEIPEEFVVDIPSGLLARTANPPN